MEAPKSGFSIVDFLIIVAFLLILSGMFGPYFAQHSERAKAAQATQPAATTQPK